MASKLPVIATPVGGIPDFLDDKETGLFCAPNNPKSLRDAILTLIDNPALKAHITATAFARVSERYEWDYVAKQMKEEVFNVIK